MSEPIKLPILRPLSKIRKPKILLLSDDLTLHSGIATMSREFVTGLADTFDWVQLAAAQQHPDHGKIKDLSEVVGKELGLPDVSIKLYCHTGYGNPQVLRELLAIERPDAILHFTDPRFWEWLYLMEHEIRSVYKIPILYYNIWDCPPAPHWNRKYYKSCDLIMNISQQTHALVKAVLGQDEWQDVLTGEKEGPTQISYVPHGIDPTKFFPISETDPEYVKFVDQIKATSSKAEFIIVWNNRNIRRKQPGDVILAYKTFCDSLPKDQAKKVLLIMHTAPVDINGTDLYAVKEAICPDYAILFSAKPLPTAGINFLYNLADVVLNIGSNEGFGLSGAEALMAGTMIINNVTGGLQDQCGFHVDGQPIKFTEEFPSNHGGDIRQHGAWVVPVFPSNRSIQGSPATPYIFDDRCSFTDVAQAIKKVYDMPKPQRKENGLLGREYALQHLSKAKMCDSMRASIQHTLSTWKPKPAFEFFAVDTKAKKAKVTGIV